MAISRRNHTFVRDKIIKLKSKLSRIPCQNKSQLSGQSWDVLGFPMISSSFVKLELSGISLDTEKAGISLNQQTARLGFPGTKLGLQDLAGTSLD